MKAWIVLLGIGALAGCATVPYETAQSRANRMAYCESAVAPAEDVCRYTLPPWLKALDDAMMYYNP